MMPKRKRSQCFFHPEKKGVLITQMLFASLIAVAISTTTQAAPQTPEGQVQGESGWMTRDYHYIIVEQDVRDVLKEFGRNLALPVEVSRNVRGKVKGEIRATTAREFLEQVCASNDLAWYFDGGVLHIATRQELSQRTFDLARVNGERLMEDIENSGTGEPLRARLTEDGSTLQAWGMDAWLESIARHIERLRSPAASGRGEVKVFRGSTAPSPAE